MKCPKCSGLVVAKKTDDRQRDDTFCMNCGWRPAPTKIRDDSADRSPDRRYGYHGTRLTRR